MKISEEGFKHLKQFIKEINFNKKWETISEGLIHISIKRIIENINYKDKKYIEILKEIYED